MVSGAGAALMVTKDKQEEAPPPPGWYPDPTDAQRQRYWDGEAWTTHTGVDSRSKLDGVDVPRARTGAVQTWERASFVVTYLLGGFLLGPIAMRYAGRAEGARAANERELARQYARAAKLWTIAALVIGVVTALVVLDFLDLLGRIGLDALEGTVD